MTLRIPVVLAGIGLLACLFGLFLAPTETIRAWLVAVLTVMDLPLGALWILMIHALTGGRWGEPMRPVLQAMVATLPLFLLLMVPLLFALDIVFPFLAAAPDMLPPTVRNKLGYLSSPWLQVRLFIYAVFWLGLAWLNRPDSKPDRRRAIVGLIVHGLLTTLFTTDWMQALEPEFSSTVYAMLVASEAGTIAFAAACLVGLRRSRLDEASEVVRIDQAKLLLSGSLFWLYLFGMQGVIIWIGDLPDEIGWYLDRGVAGWAALGWISVLVFALLPIGILLTGRGKANQQALAGITVLVLFGGALQAVWRVAPAFPTGPTEIVGILAALAAVSGLWLVCYGFAGRSRQAVIHG